MFYLFFLHKIVVYRHFSYFNMAAKGHNTIFIVIGSNECFIYILTDFNYATLTSPYIFQNNVKCKLPLLR